MPADHAVTATFIENWPAPLVELAPPHSAHALSPQDLHALLSQEPEFRARLGYAERQSFSNTLEFWITDALPRFQDGVFARLGMCSFTTPQRPPQCLTQCWQVLRQLAHPGERAVSMAYRRRYASEPVWLFLRAWREIPPWTELRLFFRERQLVGATQLHSRLVFPELAPDAYVIGGVIRKAAATIVNLLHLPHVVVDIRLTHDSHGFELVELNPFFPATGPGLFTWAGGGDFDYTFRYRRTDGASGKLPLGTCR